MTEKVDVVVIGGGSGGYAAAGITGKAGLKTVVIEAAKEMGGLCILRGCMPTKALLETSERMRQIREAEEFGIEVGRPALNFEAMMERKNSLVKEFQHYRVQGLENGPFEIVREKGKFLDPRTVAAGDRIFEAQYIVVSTGSTENIPDVEGLAESPFWTSDEVLEMEELPQEVIVVGTGAVGLESAFFLQGLGVKVRLFSRSLPLLKRVGEEVSTALERRCADLGIEVVEMKALERVSHQDGEFCVTIGDGREFCTEQLIMATGRKPFTEGLDLEKAGFGDDRITIDEQGRTKIPHIYAAGDCASPQLILHLAVKQGEAAGRNIVADSRGLTPVAHWNPDLHMFGIFADPEIVQVGFTEDEARSKGYDPLSVSYPFADQGKGMIVGEKHGVAVLIADRRTGRLLGAAAMGPGVVDHGHCILVAISQGMTAQELLDLPFYHPTLGEIWSYVAEDLVDELA